MLHWHLTGYLRSLWWQVRAAQHIHTHSRAAVLCPIGMRREKKRDIVHGTEDTMERSSCRENFQLREDSEIFSIMSVRVGEDSHWRGGFNYQLMGGQALSLCIQKQCHTLRIRSDDCHVDAGCLWGGGVFISVWGQHSVYRTCQNLWEQKFLFFI